MLDAHTPLTIDATFHFFNPFEHTMDRNGHDALFCFILFVYFY